MQLPRLHLIEHTYAYAHEYLLGNRPGIKEKSHPASLTSSGFLWRGYFTNTETTNQRDVTPFYIIRQHGEKK